VVVDAPEKFTTIEQCHVVRDLNLRDPSVLDAQCVYRMGA
jgi:hypothetical protein